MKTTKHILTACLALTLWANAAEKQNTEKLDNIIKNLQVIESAQKEVLKMAKEYNDSDILDQYTDSESVTVLKKWFALLDQVNDNKMYFMADSATWIKYVILEHIRFEVSPEHFNAMKNRIDMVLDMAKDIQSTDDQPKYTVTATQLNLREAPILMDITKRALLNEREHLSLIYTMKNQEATWGFVRTSNNDRGWINMKHVKELER